MNKLAFLFLLPCFFSLLYALPSDNKAPIDVKAQTVIIDEANGYSIYTGDAKLVKGSLALSAEEIQIFSTKHSVSKIIAKGSQKKPAHYKQNQSNQPSFVEASALTIVYFVDKQLLRLEGNAHLFQGFDFFSGGTLHYDIKKDKIIAKKSRKSPQRVKFKIKL